MHSARLAAVTVVLLCAQCLAQEPSTLDDWVGRVQADRTQAEMLVDGGNLRSAADLLFASWRGLPPAYPELADTAFASMQLLMFIMEYLMDEAAVSQFVAESLNAQSGDPGKFVRVLYDIAIGQPSPGKTQATIEMTYLTESENPFVRIGALYMLSEPYYYTNEQFVSGMSGVLVRDFPNLVVTQEAVRLSLYEIVDEEPGLIAQHVITEPTDPPKSRDSASASAPVETVPMARLIQNDPVAACIRDALPDFAGEPSRALQRFCDTAVNAPDWRTRYGCLRIAEKKAADSPVLFNAAVTALAKRADATPDVAHARVLAGDGFRKSWRPDQGTASLDEALQATLQLVQTRWAAFPYERNQYEEILKEAQNMAAWMAQNGHAHAARTLYQAIAAKYPQSIVAAACVAPIGQPAPGGS